MTKPRWNRQGELWSGGRDRKQLACITSFYGVGYQVRILAHLPSHDLPIRYTRLAEAKLAAERFLDAAERGFV